MYAVLLNFQAYDMFTSSRWEFALDTMFVFAVNLDVKILKRKGIT